MSTDLIERLSDLQIRRPWVPLLGAAPGDVGLRALRLDGWTWRPATTRSFPTRQPSVRELHRVQARTASAQTVFVLLEGPDRAVLRAMGDALAPRLLALGPEIVSTADDGTREARAFLSPRAGLFLEPRELERLRDDVFARWDYEVAKESDQLLDDTGPPVTIDDIEKRLRKKGRRYGGDDGSDGYYERKDGTALVVIVRSPIPGGDLERIGPALRRIEAAVSRGGVAPGVPGRARRLRRGHADRLHRIRQHPKRPARRGRSRHRPRPRGGAPLLHAPSRAAGHGDHHRRRAWSGRSA